ncbi:hypothetical protein FRB90_005354 [Tulasnella sp. 427]|nr:hypothetical protein FRB90_005354 [Tulasnella sp. 427]
MYVTGGQPPRAPEPLSCLVRNTAGRIHNICQKDGHALSVSFANKTSFNGAGDKAIARAYTPTLSWLITLYIVYIWTIQVVIKDHAGVDDEAVTRGGDYLFSILGQHETKDIKRRSPSMLTYVGHKVVGRQGEQKTAILDLQAGHSSDIPKRWYDTEEQKLGGSLSEGELKAFEDISFAHHEAFQPDVEDESRSTGSKGKGNARDRMELDPDKIEYEEGPVGVKEEPITPSPVSPSWRQNLEDDEDNEVEELPSDVNATIPSASLSSFLIEILLRFSRTQIRGQSSIKALPGKISITNSSTRAAPKRHTMTSSGRTASEKKRASSDLSIKPTPIVHDHIACNEPNIPLRPGTEIKDAFIAWRKKWIIPQNRALPFLECAKRMELQLQGRSAKHDISRPILSRLAELQGGHVDGQL